jgi:hypothetical protein
MAIKAILEKLDDAPEALREHYTEKDGKFILSASNPVGGYALEDVTGPEVGPRRRADTAREAGARRRQVQRPRSGQGARRPDRARGTEEARPGQGSRQDRQHQVRGRQGPAAGEARCRRSAAGTSASEADQDRRRPGAREPRHRRAGRGQGRRRSPAAPRPRRTPAPVEKDGKWIVEVVDASATSGSATPRATR